MGAIVDLSSLVNLSTGGGAGAPENIFFHKVARIGGAAATAPIAGRAASLWTYDGFPGPGAAPGSSTWANCDNTTAGGLKQTDPGGGRSKYLIQAWATGLVGGTIILYDRLGHNGALSGTTTTAQTFTGTPSRYTDGVGNIAWIEIYSTIGTTSTTVTMSYTDVGDSIPGGTISPAVAIGNTGFREVTRCIMLPLAAGDTGIKSIANVDLLASTVTAGAFGVTLGHPLAYLAIGGPGGVGWRDFTTGLPGIPEIMTDACLSLLWIPTTTTVPELLGGISLVEV